MDLEDYLTMTYTPLKSIEILNSLIYEKCNEVWDMFSGEESRKNAEELLALNFAIKLCTKHLIKSRRTCLDNL